MSAAGLQQLLDAAPKHLPVYLERIGHLSHENKGIRRSEMFFLYANVAALAPQRIVESGRARAQSTLVLSLLFPEAEIISIESDANSPDVAIAADRLRERPNVSCRFGDARRELPEMVSSGDVVLIDGPKDFRALKLALDLLSRKKPAAVFIHDLWPRSPARGFVDRHLRTALLSDDPEWVRRYAQLDGKSAPAPLSPNERRAYGASMGCFFPGQENYRARLWQCRLAQGVERAQATSRKLRGGAAPRRPEDFAIVA
jgi:hypothetical protein